jgi:hypothetical protein
MVFERGEVDCREGDWGGGSGRSWIDHRRFHQPVDARLEAERGERRESRGDVMGAGAHFGVRRRPPFSHAGGGCVG